jgi:hypothetical protein
MKQILPLFLALLGVGFSPLSAATYQVIPGEPIKLEDDVKTLFPGAPILRQDQYVDKGSTVELLSGSSSHPEFIWIERSGDWIEPANAIQKSRRLEVNPTEMKLTELDGVVDVTLADGSSMKGTEGMVVPEGATLRTSTSGTAAVILGGVSSVRLIGGTEVSVSQQVGEGNLRNTTINLTKGGVFSRVGQRLSETQSFKVKTPFGIAAAKGTDYVTIALPQRMDVWIAQGTVQVEDNKGTIVGTVSGEPGAVKILRSPVLTEPSEVAEANSLTMGAAVDVIPGLNKKLAAIRLADPALLTPDEKAFLAQVRTFKWLVKAKKVETETPASDNLSPTNNQLPSLRLTPPDASMVP